MSSVSVVMVSYYTGPILWLAVDSVLAQPECKELIIVNNGNVPGDEQRLALFAAREPRVRFITGHGNVGFAKGCNLGAASATGDYILLLNPDCMLPAGGLAHALTELQRYPGDTLAGCFLCNPDGTEQRGGRRALLTPGNAIIEGLGLHRVFKRLQRLNYHETAMPEATYEVPAISGAFMLLARAFFMKLGGLDEGYFLHMEDMDFCYRVHESGGSVICIPDIQVMHFRSTSEATSSVLERHKAKGLNRYLRLHFGNQHSALFFQVMALGAWIRCICKIALNAMDKLFVPPLEAKQEMARLALIYHTAYFTEQGEYLAGKTVLITGASGGLGLTLTGKALARGAHVIAVYNKTYIPFLHPRLRWVKQELAETGISFNEFRAELLLHAAPLELLPPILPKLCDVGVKRVIAFGDASIAVHPTPRSRYGKKRMKNIEQVESDILRISAEKMRDVTILRSALRYGTALDGDFSRMADIIRRFGFLPVSPPAKGLRQPVQVNDLVDAALTIVDNEKTYAKSYNLGGGEVITHSAMLERLFTYLGKTPRLIPFPSMPAILDMLGMIYQFEHLNGERARCMNYDIVCDIQGAVEDFGYHPHGFLEGDVVV